MQAKRRVEAYAAEVKTALGDAWLPELYRQRILTKRTRAYHFEGSPNKARVQVQHTLLGVELKVGRRRLLCPDLATARYLSVFARAGCDNVAVPYDITKISQLADELESSWHRTFLLADHYTREEPDKVKMRLQRVLVENIAAEIAAAGAGPAVPAFKQSTKQRK
jgi:hypothetical protein